MKINLHLQQENDGLNMTLVCLCAHTDGGSRQALFNSLHKYVWNKTLILGDFNSVIDPCDRLSGNLDPTSDLLKNFLTDHNFWEPNDSHLSTFTYHHPSMPSRKSRLDRCYLNFDSNWKGYVQFAPFSDHYIVGLFVPKPVDLGPKSWHFPLDLLLQEEFCLQINLILNCFDKSTPNASWEMIKLWVQE